MPRLWLMTDERAGAALWPALRALPPRSGVVFRHGATPPAERRRLLRQVRRIATARRLVLVVAGGASGAGVHGRAHGGGLHTWSAHHRREALTGARAGADVLFVSPVFTTRSHPGRSALGPAKAARAACGLGIATVALGGMNRRRWLRIRHWGFHGWAAIDALTRRPQARS